MSLSMLRETTVGQWNGNINFLQWEAKKRTFYMKIWTLRKQSVREKLGIYMLLWEYKQVFYSRKKIYKRLFHCIIFILKNIFVFVLFVPLRNTKTVKREGHMAKKKSSFTYIF